MDRKRAARIFTITLLTLFFCLSVYAAQVILPPAAEISPVSFVNHQQERIDNYFWLRGKEKPEVIEYLKAENNYAEKITAHTADLQKTLYDEMRGRIKETDMAVPVKIDDYYYYSRTEEGKQYKVYCRKMDSLSSPEQIILDVNKLSKGHKYYYVGVVKVSPDHNLLAYGVDVNGAEDYDIFFKNLETNKLTEDKIEKATTSMEWAKDNKTLFYIKRKIGTRRPFKIFKHKLGNDGAADTLVYHEKDEAFYLNLGKTKSNKYLYIHASSAVTSETRFIEAEKPDSDFKVFLPRKQDVEYSIHHQGDYFFILINNDHEKNFKLVRTPVDQIEKNHWEVIIPHDKQVLLEHVDAFYNFLVVYERREAIRQVRIIDSKTGKSHYVSFDEPIYSIRFSENPEYKTDVLRFGYSSFLTPKTIYDYNMSKKELRLLKRVEVLGGYDPGQYAQERLYATAKDGVKIPMSVVYKKGLKKTGMNPCYLYGYGAYGYPIDPRFKSRRLSLLDRGFIFVIAHVRGGGALGRYWYEEGKLKHKKNTFTDFIACANHLINEKYTNPEKLVISGASAGGLLIGSVLNMRPDLFEVAVADVPFVDLINTMLDETIPLTVIEWEEWGNPNVKEDYDYMISYSPYDNVKAMDYPNMLITAGLNDTRVFYWEPAKWAAKLRANKIDKNTLILKTKMGSGHFGASGRFDYLKEVAFEYAFILDKLSMVEKYKPDGI